MTKSELMQGLARQYYDLPYEDVEQGVKTILDGMFSALSDGNRIEIRGFGSFALRHRTARMGRNPKTGQSVQLNSKQIPHFKSGKELRQRVNRM